MQALVQPHWPKALRQLWKFEGAADAMKSRSYRLLLGMGLIMVAGLARSQPARDPLAPLPPRQTTSQPPPAILLPRVAPAGLFANITALGRSFDGIAGISVVSLTDGWQADYNATRLYP